MYAWFSENTMLFWAFLILCCSPEARSLSPFPEFNVTIMLIIGYDAEDIMATHFVATSEMFGIFHIFATCSFFE